MVIFNFDMMVHLNQTKLHWVNDFYEHFLKEFSKFVVVVKTLSLEVSALIRFLMELSGYIDSVIVD